jgi:hypothetical protein
VAGYAATNLSALLPSRRGSLPACPQTFIAVRNLSSWVAATT